MKKSLLFVFTLCTGCLLAELSPKEELYQQYIAHASWPSDINEHLPLLRQLASECSTVTEIGIRTGVSTRGILQGLSESPYQNRSYLGIDLYIPEVAAFLKNLSEKNQIHCHFLAQNDLTIDLEPVDMLFIDSFHSYCHMTYELETFSSKVKKYIAMHDTSEPYGWNDQHYNGDYSEYPAHIDRTKRGLWPAVVDFLSTHPEWKVKERRLNNCGFTVLERSNILQ